MTFQDYISPKGERDLKKYKYSGGDSSYYFKFIVSPLAAAIVERLPRWLAPNLITILAFSLHVLIYCLIY